MSAYGISDQACHTKDAWQTECFRIGSFGELMWHFSENVFKDVMWAFRFFKIVKRIAIITKRQKNNMARRHIDFGSNKKM